MSADISDAEVRSELWDSFLSLLKCYSAVASQHGIEHKVSSIAEGEVFVTAGRSVLGICCFVSTGSGEWALGREENDSRGDFCLNTDGTISLNGIALDMDHAAIDLIASLTRTASRKDIEVPV